MIIADVPSAKATGLYMLFAKGERPDRAALLAFANAQFATSITHDPAGAGGIHVAAVDGERVDEPVRNDGEWLELLRDGLMFDLVGLGGGAGVDFPPFEHRFDLQDMPDIDGLEALHLRAGPHLSGGERSIPVAKAALGVARDLAQHFENLVAVVWPPACSAIGRRYFESTMTAWLEGGPFPALGLSSFYQTVDGALESIGFDYWVERELIIEPALASDKAAATRLAVRLMNQLVILGGVDEGERIIGPDGRTLLLSVTSDGKHIRVSQE